MDNNQLPPLLEFTDTQRAILTELLTQVTYVLSDMRFNDPKEDHTRIRQHAALSGERDALRNLLGYDQRLISQAEQQLPSISTNTDEISE